ncbi:hypothetical protein AB5N19_13371 [Seiridium cardinale]
MLIGENDEQLLLIDLKVGVKSDDPDYDRSKGETLVTVTEITFSDTNNDEVVHTPSGTLKLSEEHLGITAKWSLPAIVSKAFENSRSRRINDPILTQWRDPDHRIHNFCSLLINYIRI